MIESPMQVTLLDHMGTDLTVVDAARVSFNKESEYLYDNNGIAILSDKDGKLIRYLAKHNHWTCFGHCFAQFRIKAPIFVARQLVKHQVGLVWNEVSRRYVDTPPEFWFPIQYRGRPEGNMKQGSTGTVEFDTCNEILRDITEAALETYNDLLKLNVAPEQARMVLPLNTHTEWYWSGSLAAWARVCKLRLDAHAQAETAEVAKLIDAEISNLFPVSWEALK